MKLGTHLILELVGCANHGTKEEIEPVLIKAARDTGATVLFSHLHGFGEGMGVTGVVILAESHLTIHTWPEYGYAAVDVFVCGDCKPENTIPALLNYFQPKDIHWGICARGIPPDVRNKD